MGVLNAPGLLYPSVKESCTQARRRSEVQVHLLAPTAESGKVMLQTIKTTPSWQNVDKIHLVDVLGAAAYLICCCGPKEQGQAGEGERAPLPQPHRSISKACNSTNCKFAATHIYLLHLHSAHSSGYSAVLGEAAAGGALATRLGTTAAAQQL